MRETHIGKNRKLFSYPGISLERESVLAFGVAFLAARHEIALCGFATANDRHEMIHGQTRRWEFAAAMVANADGSFALPPLAGTQLSSLSALTADFFFTDRD